MSLFNNKLSKVPLGMLDTDVQNKFTGYDTSLAQNTSKLTDIAINAKYPPVPQVGCVGDGITDDTTTLNNIIANAPIGATIVLGNHYCAGKITGSKRLNFVGQNFLNANSSVASLSGLKFANLAVCIDWTGNVSFEKLIIQGVGKDTSSGIGIQVYNGALALEKVTIQNFNTAVHVTYGYYNKFNNSYIGYCKYGLVLDNCYNTNAVGLAVTTDTTPIQLNNNSHMRMLGGSVEGFQSVGINVTGNSLIDLFGTYFEGGGSLTGYGVQLANGCQANTIGCHVYMTSMISFISCADVANTTGINIFSRNNKIVYPTTAFTCTVYKFKTNDVTSYVDIAGDIWNTSAGAGVAYIDTTVFANQLAQSGNYSIILPSNHPDSGSKDIYTKNHIVAKTKVTPTPVDGEFLFFLNNGFGTDDPLGIHGVYGYHSYRAVYQNGQWEKVGIRIPNQANSVATDVPTLVTDFNNLLTKLRNNGIMI